MRLRHHSGRVVHLIHGTNVRPARDLPAVVDQLDTYASAIRARLGVDTLGVSLWLPPSLAAALAVDGRARTRLRAELDARGLNVKVVAALSPQLFARQDAAYREATASSADRWDAMAITNGAFKLMADWVAGPAAREYSLSADWDDRWRTGGSVDEVADEAHLSAPYILAAIDRFATEREVRRASLRTIADAISSGVAAGS